MSELDAAAAEAHDAIAMALHQLGLEVLAPLGRIDQAARAAYWELGNEQAAIVQRLALQVQPGIAQLEAEHRTIAGNLATGPQLQLDALHNAVSAPAARIHAELLGHIQTSPTGG